MRRLKAAVKRAAPRLVSTWLALRGARALRRARPRMTPHGFLLAGDEAMVGGTFELVETEAILRALASCDAFVDVGANIGFYSCLARSKGRPVIAVEPLADNLEYLFLNLRANGWEETEIFPVGLAEAPGIAVLYGGSTGASVIRSWAGNSPASNRCIALSTLDTLLRNRCPDQRLLIKIDVEGAEYGVLAGARDTLLRVPAPRWVVEVCLTEHHPDGINPRFGDVFALFREAGYEAFTLDPDGSRLVTREQVSEWVRDRSRPRGLANYLFQRPGFPPP